MFAKVGLFEHIFPLFGYRLTISFYNKGEFEYKNSATYVKHQRLLISKMLFIINKKTKFV